MSTSDKVEVKSRISGENKVIGEATFVVYDSTAEAIDVLGDEKCCEHINAQVRTNEMNRVRAVSRGGPSKSRLQSLAITAMTPEDWLECAEDESKIAVALEAKAAEIKARMEAAPVEPVVVED